MKKLFLFTLIFIPCLLFAQIKSGSYQSDYWSGYKYNNSTGKFESIGSEWLTNGFMITSEYMMWEQKGEEELYYRWEFIEDKNYDGDPCGVYSIKNKNSSDEVSKWIIKYKDNEFWWYLDYDSYKGTYISLMIFKHVKEID